MKPKQTSLSNELLGERPNPQPQCNRKNAVPTVLTITRAIIRYNCQSSAKHMGHEAVQKGNPYHHEVQKYRNTSVIPLILHHFTHKKYARMKYYTVMCDDCNLALTEINIAILRNGVPAHRFTKEFLSPLSLNVQNLDVGLALELYFRRLNVKYATCSQIFTNAFRSRKSAMFLLHENQYLVSLGQIS